MRADHIVTGALTSKHQIVRAYGVPPERVHVVPFGVNLATFHPDDRTVGRALVRERVGEDRPYVLFAASLHPRKNLGAVRQAVTGLAERGCPHVLVLVAAPAPDRPDSSDLEAEAIAELPGFPGRVVRFIDPPDQQLSALMSGADAVCQPSTSEGFGLTPLEAMATGAAIVVSEPRLPSRSRGAGWIGGGDRRPRLSKRHWSTSYGIRVLRGGCELAPFVEPGD